MIGPTIKIPVNFSSSDFEIKYSSVLINSQTTDQL